MQTNTQRFLWILSSGLLTSHVSIFVSQDLFVSECLCNRLSLIPSGLTLFCQRGIQKSVFWKVEPTSLLALKRQRKQDKSLVKSRNKKNKKKFQTSLGVLLSHFFLVRLHPAGDIALADFWVTLRISPPSWTCKSIKARTKQSVSLTSTRKSAFSFLPRPLQFSWSKMALARLNCSCYLAKIRGGRFEQVGNVGFLQGLCRQILLWLALVIFTSR